MRRSFSPSEIWCPLGRYLAPWVRVCLLGSVIRWSVGVYRPCHHGFSTFICFVLFLRVTSMYPMLGLNFYIDEGDLELSCLHTPECCHDRHAPLCSGFALRGGGWKPGPCAYQTGLLLTELQPPAFAELYSDWLLPVWSPPTPPRTALLFGTPVAP